MRYLIHEEVGMAGTGFVLASISLGSIALGFSSIGTFRLFADCITYNFVQALVGDAYRDARSIELRRFWSKTRLLHVVYTPDGI